MANFLFGVIKSAEVNKEFLVLVGILIVLIAMLVMLIKAYINFKVKQEHCEGRFNLIERTANEARSESAKALNIVKNVERCTDKINTTVEEIKNKVDEITTDFIQGKYAKAEERKEKAV